MLTSSLSPFRQMQFSTKIEIYKVFCLKVKKIEQDSSSQKGSLMQTHTHQKFTTRLLSSKNHQVRILLHHLHKARVECPSCPNASILHPKLPYLSLNPKSGSFGCPPTRELNQFSSSPKCSRSIIVTSPPPSS